MQINKFFSAIGQTVITFFIKIIFMKNFSISGNSKIDKIVYLVITIMLIALTIKTFIDAFFIKKNKKTLGIWSSFLLFLAFSSLTALVYYLSQFIIFWAIIFSLILAYSSYLIINKEYRQLIFTYKGNIKKIIKYYYELKSFSLRVNSKIQNVVRIKTNNETFYALALPHSEAPTQEQLEYAISKTNLKIITNYENEPISEYGNYILILLDTDAQTQAIKFYEHLYK